MAPALIRDAQLDLWPKAERKVGESDWSKAVHVRLEHARPRPADPVFFLLYPAPDAAEPISQLARHLWRELRLPLRPPAAERLHASLVHLCPFEGLRNGALDAIADVLANLGMPRFVAQFDHVMNFGRASGRLVLCGQEGVTGIHLLQSELGASMRKIGFSDAQPAHTPHITLNYGQCRLPPQMIEEISWPVEEVTLVCSLRGRRRHVRLASWQLRAGPAPN
jgi:2'-5' RNA ligase